MPPWFIYRSVGIRHFKNDPSLSDNEIATIASWVDAGAPRGSAADMPPAVQFPDDDAWQIGTPDLIIEIPSEHVVQAEQSDVWANYTTPTGLTEDRYNRGARPTRSGRGRGHRDVVVVCGRRAPTHGSRARIRRHRDHGH
jgi:hypothetical protein